MSPKSFLSHPPHLLLLKLISRNTRLEGDFKASNNEVSIVNLSNFSLSAIEKVKVIHGRQQVIVCNIAKYSTQSDAAMRNFMRLPVSGSGNVTISPRQKLNSPDLDLAGNFILIP